MKEANILICEDEVIVALGLEEMLLASGYSVSGIANSGKQALSIAATGNTSLALMDINIKGDLPGTAVAKRLYKEYSIPSIFVTAHCDSAVLEKAKEANPLGYLLKPIRPYELFATLEMAQNQITVREKFEQAVDSCKQRVEKVISSPNTDINAGRDFRSRLVKLHRMLLASNNHSSAEQLGFDQRIRQSDVHDLSSRLLYEMILSNKSPAPAATALPLNQLLQMALTDFDGSLSNSCSMSSEPGLEQLLILCQPEETAAALCHVILNALEATPRSTSETTVGQKIRIGIKLVFCTKKKYDWYLKISVEDSGSGISTENSEVVFTPFYTTKDPNLHQGLGLTIAQILLKRSDGFIEVGRNVAQQNKILVCLPLDNTKH